MPRGGSRLLGPLIQRIAQSAASNAGDPDDMIMATVMDVEMAALVVAVVFAVVVVVTTLVAQC